jgi:hypothetical protein
MAIPPEPIAELVAEASLIIEAQVMQVVAIGPTPKQRPSRPGHTDIGNQVAAQTLLLKVQRVLGGELPETAAKTGEMQAEKPIAAYALKVGSRGAFFLAGDGPVFRIIGRYGPDTYRVAVVEQALQAQP